MDGQAPPWMKDIRLLHNWSCTNNGISSSVQEVCMNSSRGAPCSCRPPRIRPAVHWCDLDSKQRKAQQQRCFNFEQPGLVDSSLHANRGHLPGVVGGAYEEASVHVCGCFPFLPLTSGCLTTPREADMLLSVKVCVCVLQVLLACCSAQQVPLTDISEQSFQVDKWELSSCCGI